MPRRKRLPPTPVLETTRLRLRPIRSSDGPALQRRFPHWEVVQYLSRAPWPYPADGGQSHADLCVERAKKRADFCWAITLKAEGDELVGLINLRPDDGESREQRGFWIHPDYWGRGLMFEAAERVTEYAFVDLDWLYLWLDNAAANTGSHRIKEKQGATVVDRVPAKWVSGDGDKIVWLLTRNAWFARRAAQTRQNVPETPVLETERLVLRPFRLDDAPVVQRRFGQWDVIRHLTAQVPWPYPADGALENAARAVGEMERREKLLWAITRKGDDELIGCIDLFPDDGVSRAMRGFWLDPEFWGQGLMTEAANRVTDYALMDLGWPHLWLRNSVENIRSRRVKEKQGAREMGRVPAQYVSGPGEATVWLLTRDRWIEQGRGRP